MAFTGLFRRLIAITTLGFFPLPALSMQVLLETNLSVPEYVTNHAPLVYLHSEDQYKPSDILKHVQHSTPLLNLSTIPGLPPLDLDNLAILNDYGDEHHEVCLTSNDDITSDPQPEWLLGELPDEYGRVHNATPCVVILVEKSARDIDAFYFYFYSFDRGANITQVLEPINQIMEDTTGGMHFGNHVGDWEHNMIRFRDGEPVGIYYSQHADGRAYKWNDKTLEMTDGRPTTYSALGSHANYATPGIHTHDAVLLDYCNAGPLWDPVSSAYFFHFSPLNSTLTLLSSPASSPSSPLSSNTINSFLHFTGRWGDVTYADSDPRQRLVPKFGIRRFETGPTGPLDKQLVRKGLFPDKRHKISWLQSAVTLYMKLYPCCLRGWRVYFSGFAVICLLVGSVVAMVLGVRWGIRAYRTRGYRKVAGGGSMDTFGSTSIDGDLEMTMLPTSLDGGERRGV